ncbi:hypothetical protein [Bifidobacterium eulemuris]|uniref:Sugar ABC transporter substrate-binding protein n=1 Tax=Bifidobacterium eulemuris TaxID=1765219 RepID=A0A261G7M9_9BIFI|nr:hypothetical protein [Bifidobacterium eulemuris]OZG67447.1 sugar ABC transporter substrate-binding protein [Bifidobacterium eulemuris]QOL33010.1 sugar ABC transporter substrate-binding protein [Bifidobacterium eulemuris]
MRAIAAIRRILGTSACVAAALSLAACVPPNAAVGDAKEIQPRVEHDANRRADTKAGLVGSGDIATDRLVLDALDTGGIATAYASVESVNDTTQTAQSAVLDMVARAVDVVVVSGLAVTDETAQSWDEVLGQAREAGIPVALLNPQQPPADETLYAVSWKVNDRAADATPIDEALMTIVRDDPHERELMVTTNLEQ